MTGAQQRATAAGFLHALQTTPELFEQWNALSKDDDAGVGALIQRTFGMSQPPARADIEAMAVYIDGHLAQQVKAVAASNAEAPGHVGFIFLTQQSS